MENNEKKMMIGYTENLPIKGGDKVRIKKGTMIRTIMTVKLEKIAGRTYTIKVAYTTPGKNYPKDDPRHNESYVVENPKVAFLGAGGYWYEVDMNDVEKVNELEILVYSRGSNT